MDDFDELYAAHFTSLTTQLFAYFGNRQDAQDVVQEAFCRAWARWRHVSAYDEPVAWVRRVAWNLATSKVRRARVAATFRRRSQPVHAAPPSPDRVALLTALSALPVKQRQATVLHYLADLPVDEIAALMEVADGTAQSWLNRARTTLAHELNPGPNMKEARSADTVHDDRLAEAFTRFRSEVREEIQTPGTDAVRHATRRSRRIRVAGAAAAVLLVGAGLAVVTTVGSQDRKPSASPTSSAADLEELTTLASSTLPTESTFVISTPVTAEAAGVTHPISHAGSSPLKFVQGQDYDLAAVCRGSGTVTVTWEAPGGETGSAPVVCGGDIVRVRVIPRADGPSFQIRLTPDAEAIDRAGIAVAIIEFQ